EHARPGVRGPGRLQRAPLGGPGQALDLGDRAGALADRGARPVRARVAAADHHHVAAGGEQLGLRGDGVAGDPPVGLGQE
ncbi:hypothetical protein DF186_24145, partial [Enterococcus hirae]